MRSIKVKVLKILDNFFSNRADRYAALTVEVRKHLFLELIQEREDDIFIVTFLKSGTTWMQMICYQLLTDGDMDFKHIYDVSPWLNNAAYTGVSPLEINKLPSPRFFKCHDEYEKFDPSSKAKFIFVYRQPEDVAISLFHHVRNYNDPDFTQDQTLREYFSLDKDYNWFTFTQSWLKNEFGLNVLYVSYSDLKKDFDNSLKRIAAFLEIELTDEIAQRVKERSSFEFMKEHEDKFGEQPKDKRVYDQFIREGKVGSGKDLSVEQRDFIQRLHHELIQPHKNSLN